MDHRLGEDVVSFYDFDITIIGAGCMGASMAHEFSRRGFQNVGIVDSGRKSISATANSGGMLRVFHESPTHVELALQHYRLFSLYQKQGVFSDSPHPNGHLYFFKRRRLKDYSESLQRMRKAGYPFEVFDRDQGESRFPQYRWAEDDQAVFEPAGSHHAPNTFVDDLLLAAKKATILENFAVKRICPYLGQYRLFSHDKTITTKLLILAGGAQILPQLRCLGIDFPLETKTISAYTAKAKKSQALSPNYFDRETLEYARLGSNSLTLLSNPNPMRLVDKNWETTLSRLSAKDCYAPDRQGVSGQVPGHTNLFLATGWGGTGFKFSLAVGHRMAEIIESQALQRRRSMNAHL